MFVNDKKEKEDKAVICIYYGSCLFLAIADSFYFKVAIAIIINCHSNYKVQNGTEVSSKYFMMICMK